MWSLYACMYLLINICRLYILHRATVGGVCLIVLSHRVYTDPKDIRDVIVHIIIIYNNTVRIEATRRLLVYDIHGNVWRSCTPPVECRRRVYAYIYIFIKYIALTEGDMRRSVCICM
jgi:hypothetical protein